MTPTDHGEPTESWSGLRAAAAPVLVHKLISTGTIEERIDEMITSKRSLAKRVVGDGEQWLTELSTDQLRDVIALRTSEVD